MKRTGIARTILIAALAAAAHCAPAPAALPDGGVGLPSTPCTPTRPPENPDRPHCDSEPIAPAGGCFLGDEVVLQRDSPECDGETCVAYHWDERVASADERDRLVFCSRECREDSECPSGYECTALAPGLGASTAGCYCIPGSTLGVGAHPGCH